MFIEILLHMLMGNADTLMLSQYSDNAVAAVGVSNQIIMMIIVMFGFIATGTSIIVAQYLGAQKEKEASEVVVVSLGANLVFSFVLSICLFLFAEPVLLQMGVEPEVLVDAVLYTQITGGFAFILALIMTTGAAIKSYGFTRDAMYVTMGMNIINVVGNYMFIFGPFGLPVLGVQGVAIATAVSRSLGLIAIIYLLVKRVETPLPFRQIFSLPKGYLSKLLRIGIPSAGEHLAYNTSQVLITFFVVMLGTEMITTRVYTINIMMFIFVFAIAIGQGTQILIGHKVGEGKLSDAYQTCNQNLRYALVISITMAIIATTLSEHLFSIFTDNPNIIAVGSTLIMLCIILEPGRCFNVVVINSLRAAGDVKFPVYMGIASMLGISVPLAYYLGIYHGLGLMGVWIAMIVDEWLRGILMMMRWRSRVWENMSFVREEKEKPPVQEEAVSG
ncbi:MATE family efflux transporter [Caldalkalibacillus salinus]|uniref:MATE family efflux transporter n=1 Tax=Caldalkalibacillus salinus TaxID=2803787 RepID=UPI003019D62E